MFIEQPPWIFRALYPKAIFRMSPDEKAVYLTFDDGPIPEVTPWVLELLDKYDIKATFFMVGDNIRKYPDIFRMVVDRESYIQPYSRIRILCRRIPKKHRSRQPGNEDRPLPPATRTYGLQAISHTKTTL